MARQTKKIKNQDEIMIDEWARWAPFTEAIKHVQGLLGRALGHAATGDNRNAYECARKAHKYAKDCQEIASNEDRHAWAMGLEILAQTVLDNARIALASGD